MNIHSGISNQDIIDFLEGKVKENIIKLVEDINEDKDNKLLLEEAQRVLAEIEESTKLPNETEEQFNKRKDLKKKF